MAAQSHRGEAGAAAWCGWGVPAYNATTIRALSTDAERQRTGPAPRRERPERTTAGQRQRAPGAPAVRWEQTAKPATSSGLEHRRPHHRRALSPASTADPPTSAADFARRLGRHPEVADVYRMAIEVAPTDAELSS
jgi:hypothetical protein